jgi:flavodoxin
MKPCVLYVSRTGNTRRLAEAISELLEAPIFDITKSEPAVADNYDLLVIGTPVMGLQPAPEATAFVKQLQSGENKKAIVFCTYAIAKGGALKALSEELSKKGCVTILSVSKRGVKPNKADFADCLDEISKVVKQ